jgi:hypothetical protein
VHPKMPSTPSSVPNVPQSHHHWWWNMGSPFYSNIKGCINGAETHQHQNKIIQDLVVCEGVLNAIFSSLCSWNTGQHWMQTTAAQQCGTWRIPSGWNALTSSERKQSYSTIKSVLIQTMPQHNSWSSFQRNVLPIHHTIWTLYLETTTL